MRLSGWCWVVLACGLLAGAGTARAGLPETPQVRQISVIDGLPSNSVSDMAMDADGYLWLATDDGLARFDGINFRIWRLGQGLPTNEILSVEVDAHNRVWVGMQDHGLAVFDVQRNKMRFFSRHSRPALTAHSVSNIARAKAGEGDVWLGTEEGLYQFSFDGTQVHHVPQDGDPRSLPDFQVQALSVSPEGTLWVGTSNGAARWTGRDFERVPPQALAMASITRLFADRDGELWITTALGGSRYRNDGSFLREPWVVDGGMTIYGTLLRDRHESYWLDAYEGLYRVDGDAVWHVPVYSSLSQGMIKPQWSDALEDAEGGLWFSSLDAGLWYLPPDWRQFAALTKRAGKPGSLGNTQVYQMAASRGGGIWAVGSSGVLEEIDPESGDSTTRIADVGPGTVVHAVMEDSRGKVWMGFPAGLAQYDPATGQVQRWRAADAVNAAPRDDVVWIAEDRAGWIWCASSSGQIQARRGDDTVVVDLAAGAHAGVGRAALYQLATGPDGAIWLVTDQGILRWAPQAGAFQGVPGLPSDPLSQFAFDGEGVLWLAGLGFVDAYEQVDGQWRLRRRLDGSQGLPQVRFNGVARDRRGVLWLASDRGLVRLDPASHALRIYGIRDGLPGQEIIAPPVLRRQDGRVMISASHGLVIFDPATVRPVTTPPALNVESISVQLGDRRRQLPVTGGFVLQPDERDLRVVAHLKSFKSVASHRYRFRLQGVDADWVEVGAVGERIYNRLQHGKYRLQIMGATAENVWSQPLLIEFSVAPAWWQTWWARSGALAVLALVVVLATLAYRRRLRRRSAWQLAEHKRELAEQASLAKTRFLATLGHEVRTPMTGVLGMSELLMATPLDPQQRGYANAIQNAGKHLLRLVNDALDLARIEAGKLELESHAFDPRALVEELVALCEPLARQRGLQFTSQVDDKVPPALSGDVLRVRQILLNLLGNAIKFTERGSVRLLLEAQADGVRFSVIDTGPGISAEQQARLFQRFEQAEGAKTSARYGGSGLGLAICQELALAMGGRIRVESTPGIGTRFSVDLPLDVASVLPAASGTPPQPLLQLQPALNLQILLVEDEPTVAEVMVGLLQARGHQVTHVAHGLAALAEASMHVFDIGLLDLDLPGLDGLTLARQLRAQGAHMPLLAVTARADAEAESMARAAGFDGFLRKPVTGDMLAAAIDTLMRAAAAHD